MPSETATPRITESESGVDGRKVRNMGRRFIVEKLKQRQFLCSPARFGAVWAKGQGALLRKARTGDDLSGSYAGSYLFRCLFLVYLEVM